MFPLVSPFPKNANLITTVDLCNCGTQKKPVYHFIYASQLYGTLFGIYGQFDVVSLPKSKDNTNECCRIDNLTLFLMNYQGILNLGFTQDSTAIGTDGTNLFVDFGVQAMSNKNVLPVKLGKDFTVDATKRKKISFNRTLYPIPGFEIKSGGKSNLTHPTAEPSSAANATVFDTEFHGRSGIDYFNNPLRPGMAGHKEGLGPSLVSLRCTQSLVNLAYK